MNTQTIKTKVLNLLFAERPTTDFTSKGCHSPGIVSQNPAIKAEQTRA
jgi:hypothetical protein